MYALGTNSPISFFKGMGRLPERVLSTPFVTRNLKEFQRIDGLAVEDWY